MRVALLLLAVKTEEEGHVSQGMRWLRVAGNGPHLTISMKMETIVIQPHEIQIYPNEERNRFFSSTYRKELCLPTSLAW